jgi:TPR repeat protein
MGPRPGLRILGISVVGLLGFAAALSWWRTHRPVADPRQGLELPPTWAPTTQPEPPPAAPPIAEWVTKGMMEAKSGHWVEARKLLLEAIQPMEAWDVNREAPRLDAEATFQLGNILREGLGGPKEPLGAARSFVLSLANEAGPTDAFLGLAAMFRAGEGVAKDPAFARIIEKDLEARAKRGAVWQAPEDAARLADMFMVGNLFQRDLLAASTLFYVAKDKAKSRQALEQAAQEGVREAHFRLAFSFLGVGSPITEKDPAKAIEHFTRAGELGMPGAWYQLGLLYLKGDVTTKDDAAAFSCFSKEPDLAHYQLGMAFWEGKGTARDPELARGHLLAAVKAKKIFPDGLAALATIYKDGIGVVKDPVLAARYSPMVADKVFPSGLHESLGNPGAGDPGKIPDIQTLMTMKAPASSWLEYGKALLQQQRVASAAMAFEKASELGSAEGGLQLGRLCIGDWGMSGDEATMVREPFPRDLAKGRTLLEAAARVGLHPRPDQPPPVNRIYQEALAKADRYHGQDPRRLYYLLTVWANSGGC